MPQYSYANPKTGKVVEVIQRMSEVHEYIDDKGVKWNRVYSIPQGVVKDKSPTNAKEFSSYVGRRKGNMADVYDMSKELSQSRIAQSLDGKDPVKKEYYKNYSATRRGKKHPNQMKEGY